MSVQRQARKERCTGYRCPARRGVEISVQVHTEGTSSALVLTCRKTGLDRHEVRPASRSGSFLRLKT